MISAHDIARQVNAKRAGTGYLGRCPAHDDAHASLSIGDGDRVPVVLSCKAGCSFSEIETALGYSKGELTRTNPRGAAKVSATYNYRNADGSMFARKERLIDDVGGKSFRWSRPDSNNRERWISGTQGTIPLYRLPELIGAPIDELVLVCEGEKDCDRLASLGFVVTTPPNGAGSKWRTADSQYLAGRRVCIIADDDEPGRRKAADTEAALRSVATKVVTLTLPNPQDVKGFDVSDFLDSGGSVAALNVVIAQAFDRGPSMPVEIVDPATLHDRLIELWEGGGDERGVFPGWASLAKHYRPRLGELTIIHGSPGAGKSTFTDALVANTACGDAPEGEDCPRWKWLFFSAEQFPAHRHAAKLLQKILGKPFSDGPTARMSKDDIRAAWNIFREHFTIIDPTFTNSNLDRILEIAHQVKTLRGLDGLVIDPYNVIAATSRPKSSSEHEFINEALTKIRMFAQSERVHAVVVAHPTKMKREEGAEEYPVPRPWDISGSAHWFNHADAILAVWRAMKDQHRTAAGEVQIHTQKVRFQPECGTIGMTRLYFDRITGRYHEQSRSENQMKRESR